MTHTLVYRRQARREFDEAVDFYESRRAGLGREFTTAVDRVLTQIVATPLRYPIADGDVREAPVRKYPFCVYYRILGVEVVVISVFHTSRDPAVWQVRA